MNKTLPLVETKTLSRHFKLPRPGLFRPGPTLRAVDGVDIVIKQGESLGVVGESGCGKSTLARLVVGLDRPTSGEMKLLGQDFHSADKATLATLRQNAQMVFQDPNGSLNPRARIGWSIAEPLEAGGKVSPAERRSRVEEALQAVSLRAGDVDKYPHEFSGGQRQRIAIARALINRPKLIVADEPVSSLDVSVQAQVLNLLNEISERFGVTYLFISHDLAVVATVASRVAVMYLGRIVEQGATQDVFSRPLHPYTQLLLAAVPRPIPGRRRHHSGEITRPVLTGNQGCAYAERCPLVSGRCRSETPSLQQARDGHKVACHNFTVAEGRREV